MQSQILLWRTFWNFFFFLYFLSVLDWFTDAQLSDKEGLYVCISLTPFVRAAVPWQSVLWPFLTSPAYTPQVKTLDQRLEHGHHNFWEHVDSRLRILPLDLSQLNRLVLWTTEKGVQALANAAAYVCRLFSSRGLQDLGSLTRDWTQAVGSESMKS